MSALEKMLDSWGSLVRGLAVLTFLFVGIYVLVTRIASDVGFAALKISTQDGISVDLNGKSNYRTVLVHPRGWQSTEIQVKSGDEITLDATGSINIAMGQMIKSLNYQYGIKDKYEKSGLGRDIENFSKNELKASLFAYPWNGPEGINLKDIKLESTIKRVRDSQHKRVYPKANVGQLLLVVASNAINAEPSLDKSQIFAYAGRGGRFTVEQDGYVWFIANDLMPSEDPVKRDIEWQDNLGVFEVKMLISKSS